MRSFVIPSFETTVQVSHALHAAADPVVCEPYLLESVRRNWFLILPHQFFDVSIILWQL